MMPPYEREAAIATVYILIAVRNDVLTKQKDYSNTPILRNLVPRRARRDWCEASCLRRASCLSSKPP
jgi:hypothetical protein